MLVSIITIVYNGEEHIEKTINSVISQSYNHIQYIIIDGGSTDKTLDIITKYQDYIDVFISEKDDGISDAFNKGINFVKGNLVAFLNADDWYESDAILKMASSYVNNETIICTSINLWNKTTFKVKSSNLDGLKYHMSVWHPGVFVPINIFKKFGKFDTTYKILMDYEFFTRLYKHNVNFVFFDYRVVNMRIGGLSHINIFESLLEGYKIKNKYFGNNFTNLILLLPLYFYFKLIIVAKKTVQRL